MGIGAMGAAGATWGFAGVGSLMGTGVMAAARATWNLRGVGTLMCTGLVFPVGISVRFLRGIESCLGAGDVGGLSVPVSLGDGL